MPVKRSMPRSSSRIIKRRRYGAVKRMPRNVQMYPPVISIQRTWRASTWTPGTATTSDFWRVFSVTLGGCPSASEFTSLFDKYKINGLKVTFRPRYDSFAGNDTTDVTAPGVTNQGGNDFHIIVDPHNETVPSGTYTNVTLNSFLENGKVRSYRGNRPFSIYCKPAVGMDLQGIASAVRGPSWISTTQTGVTHYGFQAFITDPGMTGNFSQAYDLFYTIYLQLKGVR